MARGKRTHKVASLAPSLPEALEEYRYTCQCGYPGLSLDFRVQRGVVWLEGINVPDEYRGLGVGSTIVSGICDLASQYGREVLLLRRSDEGEEERLAAFYDALGFEEVPPNELDKYGLVAEEGFHYLRFGG